MTISYRRLNPLRREIRLLEIEACDHVDDPVKCRLVTVRHDEDLDYIALSSLYGDPTDTENIYVNGSSVTITTHLSQALKHVRQVFYPVIIQRYRRAATSSRLHGAPRWLKNLFDMNHLHFRDSDIDRPGVLRVWLDYLCVNQNDDWEKSKQHVEIKYIYNFADIVVGWLGMKTEHTDVAIETMFEVQEAMPPNWCKPGDRELHPDDYSPTHQWAHTIQHHWALGPNGEMPYELPHWIGCVEFITRQYFQRRWIIEEISSASFPAFLVGNALLPWKTVLSLYRIMDEFKSYPSDLFPADFSREVPEVPLETAHLLFEQFIRREALEDAKMLDSDTGSSRQSRSSR